MTLANVGNNLANDLYRSGLSGAFAVAGHIATELATEAFGHAITDLGSVLNSGGLVLGINLSQRLVKTVLNVFAEKAYDPTQHIPKSLRPLAVTVFDLATLAGLCSAAVIAAPLLGIAAPVNLAGLFALAITSRALADAFENPFAKTTKDPEPAAS